MINLLRDLTYRLHTKSPIYINAYVSRNNGPYSNWGDDINLWFLREVIRKPLRLYNESPIAFRMKSENFLVIGSTISLLCKRNSIIWGAGCISDMIPIPQKPKKVLAVRGPLTRGLLLKNEIDCPPVYGDPALLLPYHYRPTIKKKHYIGLIQHVSEAPIEIEGCHRISMSNYKVWTDVIDEILSCEIIASSSLHGLIVAEAYGIPNVWVESQNLIGGQFKFHDFFLSLGEDRKNPIDNKVLKNPVILHKIARCTSNGRFDIEPLLKSCPFELHLRNL